MSSETQDRDQARRGRSLLSLSSALAEERARVGIQSAAGYEEGKALPVSW